MRAWTCFILLLLAGCAEVGVKHDPNFDVYRAFESNLPVRGQLSPDATQTLASLAIDSGRCSAHVFACVDAIRTQRDLDSEVRTSTIAELWMSAAEHDHHRPARLDHLLRSARSAYDYLFLTKRKPAQRVFSERQLRMTWIYTYATGQVASALFAGRTNSHQSKSPIRVTEGAWTIEINTPPAIVRQSEQDLEELVPVSSLTFEGMRADYHRDGLGARFVAVTGKSKEPSSTPFVPTRFRPVTAVLRFDQTQNDAESKAATLDVFDACTTESIDIEGSVYSLAADFTAPYALWLARSGFARQSVLALFGRDDSLLKPVVILTQPYDPNRRTIVLLHGLVSSPEAWVNTVNEIVGDDALRNAYQVWQVYYPTNVPLAYSRRAIAQGLSATFSQLDPGGSAPASHDAVLIGHSMGGVLARLLITDSDERVWKALWPDALASDPKDAMLDSEVSAYLHFQALSQIGRAVFIAAPHRGTPVAHHWIVRQIAQLITEPGDVVRHLQQTIAALASDSKDKPAQAPALNSIQSLSDTNGFIKATKDLPIEPGVPYHSIIARSDTNEPLTRSSDGFVPYTSAHLDGAESELVVVSGHRVQENAKTILEVKRILREHLAHLSAQHAP